MSSCAGTILEKQERTFSILRSETKPCSTLMKVSGRALSAKRSSPNTATAAGARGGEHQPGALTDASGSEATH